MADKVNSMQAEFNYEAGVVHSKLSEDCGSIIMILMIISIIISILRLLNSCSGKRAKDFKGMIGMAIARNQIGKIVANEIGLANYKKYGREVVDALMERGVELETSTLQAYVDGAAEWPKWED